MVEEPAALYLINPMLMREVVKIDCQLEDVNEQELQQWLDDNSPRIMFPAKYQLCLDTLGKSQDTDNSGK